MSLLNQVLRDLQGRQAVLPPAVMTETVCPVPGPVSHRGRWLLVSGVTMAVFVFAFLLPLDIEHTTGSIPVSAAPTLLEVPPPVTKTPDVVQVNRLAAVRLNDDGDRLRILLEFSSQLSTRPEVIVAENQVRVLLPDLAQRVRQLPQPGAESRLPGKLTLVYRDHLWQFYARFHEKIQVQPVSLAADNMNGERLALDIRPFSIEQSASKQPESMRQRIDVQTVKVPEEKVAERKKALAKKVVVLSPTKQADVSYSQGLDALRSGEVLTAGDAFRTALKLNPQLLPARKELVRLSVSADRQLADTLVAEGLTLHDPLKLRQWYARVLIKAAGAREAAAVMITPQGQDLDDAYLALRAGLWQQATEYPRAEADYRDLVLREPNKGLYRFGLALALDQQGDVDATQGYQKALELGLKSELASYASSRLAQLVGQTGKGF